MSMDNEARNGASIYRYGCPNRPPMFAAVPPGFIANEPNPDFRFGEIQYTRRLTEDELARYELVDLAHELPTVGSLWQHTSGSTFRVVAANSFGVRLIEVDEDGWPSEFGVDWQQFRQLIARS